MAAKVQHTVQRTFLCLYFLCLLTLNKFVNEKETTQGPWDKIQQNVKHVIRSVRTPLTISLFFFHVHQYVFSRYSLGQPSTSSSLDFL